MINNLIVCLRTLRRNKLLALISIVSLTIGISACLVIFLIADYEMSYDRFQRDRDRIYRIYSQFSSLGSGHSRTVPPGVAAFVKDQFTGLEAIAKFVTFGAKVSLLDGKGNIKAMDRQEKIIFTGPEYFQVFNHYEWLIGNPKACLSEPFKVVLTESKVHAYFGDIQLTEVIGKEINYMDSLTLSVTGV